MYPTHSVIILIAIELLNYIILKNYKYTQGKNDNCDWLWENLSVTDKDKNLEIHNSIIESIIS